MVGWWWWGCGAVVRWGGVVVGWRGGWCGGAVVERCGGRLLRCLCVGCIDCGLVDGGVVAAGQLQCEGLDI